MTDDVGTQLADVTQRSHGLLTAAGRIRNMEENA